MHYEPMEKTDRRIKVALILVSLGVMGVMLAIIMRDELKPEWRNYRAQYAKILDEKAIDERTKLIADNFEAKVMQNVLPKLGVVDRCITCHPGIEDPRMIDQPQPLKTHPGNLLASHPPLRFGCTVCHRGQGRALEFAEAKGEGIFWDYPFLPHDYMQAECGRCHKVLPYGEKAVVREGKRLFESLRCVECHMVDGLGNPEGGDISTRGFRLINKKWWAGHGDFSADPKTGRVALHDMRDKDLEKLQDYLVTRHGAQRLAHGKWLFENKGCLGCHKVGFDGGSLGVELSNEGLKTHHELIFTHVEGKHSVPNWHYEHFLNPRRVTEDSQMPNFSFSKEESKALVAYMLSMRGKEKLADSYIPKETKTLNTKDYDGEALYSKFCSYCHEKFGQGRAYTSFKRSVPGIRNADWQRVARKDYLRKVVYEGRPNRDMPNWGKAMHSGKIEAIISFLEKQRVSAPTYDEVASSSWGESRGNELYRENCAFCHGDRGQGDIGPEINNSIFLTLADDKFIYETISKGRPNTPMPSWSDFPPEDFAALLSVFKTWRLFKKPYPDPQPVQSGEAFVGEPLYAEHCARCHGENGEGASAVALNNSTLISSASNEYLAYSLDRCRDSAIKSGDQSGPKYFSSQEISGIIGYIRSWADMSPKVAIQDYRPKRGDAESGSKVFAEYCAGCHGTNGRNGVSPAIGDQQLLSLIPDGFLITTLSIGRVGTIMEPRGMNSPGVERPLNTKEVLDIVAFLRSPR